VITFPIAKIETGKHIVGVYGVMNPTKDGGVGVFRLKTYGNGAVKDKNGNFGQLGISKTAPSFPSLTLANEGGSQAAYKAS
jgi:hypothetical protein